MSDPAVEERYWSKVHKTAGCWLWTASTFRLGRGQFGFDGRNQQAHRVAWQLTYGVPPAGLLRSVCGNLRCINPEHQVVAQSRVGRRSIARTPKRRFEAFVKKGPGCWLWTGSTANLGYGQFSRGGEGERKRMVSAHRMAWELAFGPIGEDAEVLHRCDTRLCVRPDHLVLRPGGRTPHFPTPRELAVLQVCLHRDFKYGSIVAAASELGMSYGSALGHLWNVRRRLGVKTNHEAVEWLDDHAPGWRYE